MSVDHLPRRTPLTPLRDIITHAALRLALAPLSGIRGGTLRVVLPDAQVLQFGDGAGPSAEIAVKDFKFFGRLLFSGQIGLSEAWIDGEWTSPDLTALLCLLAENADRLKGGLHGNALIGFAHRLAHMTRANTRKGARRNILAHYDLGNDFFAAWLDPSMTYSSARFIGGEGDLESAQAAKYRAMAEHAQVRSGTHVLEIGCGWGGFAAFAAREYGAHVTALTISDNQLAFAQARIARAGLSDSVSIRHEDYRDTEGQFDAIVSIEMLEAVGERYWPAYFSKIESALKPGGRAAVQVITIREDLFSAYRASPDFIQRHVFPGGMLPSIDRLHAQATRAGLHWEHMERFGLDYARTLALWAQAFEANWPSIRDQGFDERFRRLWRFYLAYCIAGFRSGRIDVVQVALAKPE